MMKIWHVSSAYEGDAVALFGTYLFNLFFQILPRYGTGYAVLFSEHCRPGLLHLSFSGF